MKWSEKQLLEARDMTKTDAQAATAAGTTEDAMRSKRKRLGLQHDPKVKLEQRLQHLKDELQAANGKVKDLTRAAALFEALAERLPVLCTPIPSQTTETRKSRSTSSAKRVTESLVMHLSDEHCDQVVTPSRVGGLEKYDMNVAMARAERYVDVVKRHAFENMANYDFKDLWILAYGDHVNGEIHSAVNHSHWHNAMQSAIGCGQMHAQMVAELAPMFESVKVVYLSGNHGRRTMKKEYDAPRNNWDYLVGQVAAAYLSAQDNVEVICPDSFDAVLQIEGWSFHVQHGDDIRSWNSIPWYGIERATRRLSALEAIDKRVVNYYCMGHFHGHGTQQHTTGEILLNGAWLATTPYVYNSLKAYNRPMQLIHGVHKEHGVSWRMPVYLKHKDDVNGPKRYRCTFAGGE